MKKETLKQLIENLKLNYANKSIIEENFPKPKEISDEAEIIDFKRYITSEEAIKEMEEKGYRPANAWELLKWADKNWNGKDWVVALGQFWRRLYHRLVPCLYGFGSGRDLRLGWFGLRWHGGYRFLAVRKLDSELKSFNWEKWEKEFFNQLAEKLEELFPKTNINNPEKPSKGNRTTALVFNAYANLIFREILKKVIQSQRNLKNNK